MKLSVAWLFRCRGCSRRYVSCVVVEDSSVPWDAPRIPPCIECGGERDAVRLVDVEPVEE